MLIILILYKCMIFSFMKIQYKDYLEGGRFPQLFYNKWTDIYLNFVSIHYVFLYIIVYRIPRETTFVSNVSFP